MLIYIYALIQSSCRLTLLLPVGQWVYDKSRVPLTTQAAESHGLLRVIRTISVRLNLKLQSLQVSFESVDSRYYRWSVGLRQISCSLKNSPPCSHCISVFTQNLSQKRNRLRCPTKQASLALEASFIAQRSKLHFFGVFLAQMQTSSYTLFFLLNI